MSPAEYVNSIMAGIGIILQFGRSYGMKLTTTVQVLVAVGFILALVVNEPLAALVSGPVRFSTIQSMILQGMLQFVGILASGLGGLFATSAGAHSMVKAGADPAHPLVPVTKPTE